MYSCATGGNLIHTTNSLNILEGGTNSLCVQLIAGTGNPTSLATSLVVPLSVNLDGKAGNCADTLSSQPIQY